MQELFYILDMERKALLKGFVLAFALVFPFTFVPVLVREGWQPGHLLLRVPDSALYAALFAAFVTAMAVWQNYNKLINKKYLYDLPAFTALDFHGRFSGHNSVIEDLSTFLIGKVGDYYFRVDIIDPEQQQFKVELMPFLDFDDNPALKQRIKKELKLTDDIFLHRRLTLTNEQLHDPAYLASQLQAFAAELAALGAVPVDVAEFTDLD